jgi:hypothetical protein
MAMAAEAVDIPVGTDGELVAALGSAAPGDRILLAPGVYGGGLYSEGLRGVTLTSENPMMPAVSTRAVRARCCTSRPQPM